MNFTNFGEIHQISPFSRFSPSRAAAGGLGLGLGLGLRLGLGLGLGLGQGLGPGLGLGLGLELGLLVERAGWPAAGRPAGQQHYL